MTPLRLLQFSDTHLFADPGGTMYERNTRRDFDRVLAYARREDRRPDLAIVTGDLSQDLTSESYRTLRGSLEELEAPVEVLPGNHDDPVRMAEVFRDGPVRFRGAADAGTWRIVLLDSRVASSNAGFLSQAELDRLARELEAAGSRPVLIALHHHPVPSGSEWMDTMILRNADAFFSLVDGRSNVKAVVWGHIHQEFESARNGVRLWGCPSTCVQFEPASSDFGVDARAPGYRRIFLFPNGKIESTVVRVP